MSETQRKLPDTEVVTGPARVSYLHVFEPYAQNEGQKPKYGARVLIPKEDKNTLRKIKAACEAARLSSAGLFGGKVPAKLDPPYHDGDDEKPSGGAYEPECKGMYVINAKSDQQPGLVDRRCNRIIDSTQMYSGCWCHVDLNFYAYNVNGNRGIGAGLNNLQKVRDDEPLSGHARPESVFSAVDDDEDDEDLGL